MTRDLVMLRAVNQLSAPANRYYIFSPNTAVLRKTAVFFYSTKYPITLPKATIYEKSTSQLSAVDKNRLRFLFVVKSRYMTFYRSRAPPFSDFEENQQISKSEDYKMIIKYDFLSELAGEMTEIEVDDELGKIVKEIEKNERKNDRTETRRHKYLSELEEQGYYIADDNDTFEEDVRSVQYKKLMTAIKELQPQQQELLFRVYWKKEKQKKIAAEEGVSEMAISNRMKKIIKKLKKFFE